jgi:hypothetical protein
MTDPALLARLQALWSEPPPALADDDPIPRFSLSDWQELQSDILEGIADGDPELRARLDAERELPDSDELLRTPAEAFGVELAPLAAEDIPFVRFDPPPKVASWADVDATPPPLPASSLPPGYLDPARPRQCRLDMPPYPWA